MKICEERCRDLVFEEKRSKQKANAGQMLNRSNCAGYPMILQQVWSTIFDLFFRLWATLGKFGPIRAGLGHFGQVSAAD